MTYFWLIVYFIPCYWRLRIAADWTLKRSWSTFVYCQLWRRNSNIRSWNGFTRFSLSSRHACAPYISLLSLRPRCSRQSHRSHDALLAALSRRPHNAFVPSVSAPSFLPSSTPVSFLSPRSRWSGRAWRTWRALFALWLTELQPPFWQEIVDFEYCVCFGSACVLFLVESAWGLFLWSS